MKNHTEDADIISIISSWSSWKQFVILVLCTGFVSSYATNLLLVLLGQPIISLVSWTGVIVEVSVLFVISLFGYMTKSVPRANLIAAAIGLAWSIYIVSSQTGDIMPAVRQVIYHILLPGINGAAYFLFTKQITKAKK